ncbi:hypothetical protein CONLIGDRAFT_163859 [Coniochaeta ligniaria NRRL 30616]|uniref:Extracellular membrane protein CFEM domain-containing protein n=1 Tax=Coniochaeta ligniaria NRRL 30616 TaxID=1408157 RepID=A0A1J7J137_9PEZI|nr:hypothetical protein CONLIGDRAFT_163859 [Coniochaeta ligniaria NRRL 30616]
MHSLARLAILAAVACGVSAAVIEQRAACNRDNLLRCLVSTPTLAAPYCSSSAGVIVFTPTVYVASTPTVYATTSTTTTSTGTTTGTTTTTTTTGSTSTSVSVTTRIQTIYNFPWRRDVQDKRAAPKTSLACIAPLSAAPTALASACSCFSAEYTAPAVTVTTATDPTTIYIATATLVSAATDTATDTAIITDVSVTTTKTTSTAVTTTVSTIRGP